jgi:hypothetical protein
MEQRLSGSKTREEADELVRRLEVAEALAAEKHNDYTALQYRSEVCVLLVGSGSSCGPAGVGYDSSPIHTVSDIMLLP